MVEFKQSITGSNSKNDIGKKYMNPIEIPTIKVEVDRH